MFLRLLISFIILLISFESYAAKVEWEKSFTISGVEIYRPKTESSPSVIVKYYPRVALEENITSYLTNKLSNTNPPDGRWLTTPDVTPLSPNVAYGKRNFGTLNNEKELLVIAVSMDLARVRLGAMQITKSASNYHHFYDAAESKISDLVAIERSAAKAENRPLKFPEKMPAIPNLKNGGEIRAGHYKGHLFTSTNQIEKTYELNLYDNGEFQFLTGEDASGLVEYISLTGKLGLTGTECYNGPFTTCVYGFDKSRMLNVVYWQPILGSPIKLFWEGSVSTEAPSVIQRQKDQKQAIARAEEKRKRQLLYTVLGGGVTHDDIEAILVDAKTRRNYDNYYVDDSRFYLALKDGSVFVDIDIPPALFNAKRSKVIFKERWRRWTKLHGRYHWVDLKGKIGNQIGLPAYTLSTKYFTDSKSHYEYSGGIMSPESREAHHFEFYENGRFETSRAVSITSDSASGGFAAAGSHADKNGKSAYASASSGGSIGYSSKKDSTNGSYAGHYVLDGFNLTLNYDNGNTATYLFFYINDNKNILYINNVDYIDL